MDSTNAQHTTLFRTHTVKTRSSRHADHNEVKNRGLVRSQVAVSRVV